MKKIFIILPLLVTLTVMASLSTAADYHISESLGDDSRTLEEAQNPNTPWKTINRLNGIFELLNPGDQVLFRRGERFFGSINVNKSGSVGNPIVIGAFGEGAKPIITGFKTVTNWTSLGNHIWESTEAVSNLPTCNMVTIDGVNTAKGRFPNSDYANIDSHSGTTSIASTSLVGGPNWTGAEVVIRTFMWVLDRMNITNHSGSKIDFAELWGDEPKDDYGFFIQNDIRTLDVENEWYYDKSSGKLFIYSMFEPESQITTTSIDTLISIEASYISIDGIHFDGANSYGICSRNRQSNITIKNCTISNSGINAIQLSGVSDPIIHDNTVNIANNNGIRIVNGSNNATIKRNVIRKIGLIPGAGQTGSSLSYSAIYCDRFSEGISITDNKISDIGYIGISVYSDNTLIQHNIIDSFCLILMDGGGIYSNNNFDSPDTPYDNYKILDNIVLNGVGNNQGTASPDHQAHGIYLDDFSGGVEVSGNSIANNGHSGIFVHNGHSNTITNNTIFNNRWTQINFLNSSSRVVMEDNVVTYNTIVSKISSQWAITIDNRHTTVPSIGSFDYNTYSKPIAPTSKQFLYVPQDYNFNTKDFTEWKGFVSGEANSSISLQLVPNVKDINFLYNASNSVKNIPLDNYYIDAEGTKYSGDVTLQPFTSKVLMKDPNPVLTDTTLPIVSAFLMSPSSTSLTVPISLISASDNIGITGYLLTETETPPPFESSGWSKTKPSSYTFSTEGVKILYVWVKDAAGNVSASLSNQIVITLPDVTKQNLAPVIQMGTPSGSTTIFEKESFQIKGSALDLDGDIALIEFFANNKLLGSTPQNPFEFNWRPSSEGSYVLTVKVTDNEGLESISDPFELTVKQDQSVSSGDSTVKDGYSLFVNWGSNEEVNILSEVFKGEEAVINYISGNTSRFSDARNNSIPLFQTERFGNEFTIAVPVPNGTYTVKTYHNELWFGKGGPQAKPGQRVYDILLQQKTQREKFDLFLESGNQPTVLSFEQVQVTNGILELGMKAHANNASISGLAIVQDKIGGALPDGTVTEDTQQKVQPILMLKAGHLSDVEHNGVTFESDFKFKEYYGNSSTYSHTKASDQPLFQSERNGAVLNYAIPLPNGIYTVKTYHHELYFGLLGPSAQAGRRVFDIAMENETVKEEFDLFVENQNKPTVLTFEQVSVTDGVLNIDMVASSNRATISAISIYRHQGDGTSTSEEDFTLFVNTGSQSEELFVGNVFSSEVNVEEIFFDADSWTYSNRNASDEGLFQTERNSTRLSYRIPVPDGAYTVYTLHNELYFGYAGPSARSGRRVFDIRLESETVRKGFDIFVENGNKPTVLEFKDIMVNDGFLDLEMLASQNRATLSGLAIIGNPKDDAIYGSNFRKYMLKEGLKIEKEEQVLGKGIKIYPNPVIDKVTVEIKDDITEGRILIHSMNGQLIQSFNLEWLPRDKQRYTISLSDISPAIYLISIAEKFKVITTKRLIVKP